MKPTTLPLPLPLQTPHLADPALAVPALPVPALAVPDMAQRSGLLQDAG